MNVLAVVVGFSLIILVHELGHFMAARWARIRVLAFAIGFGPAIVSWRQGPGLRVGSSEPEHRRRIDDGTDRGWSPTEYRFNAIPFGGYVKMLGQEDADPTAASDEPDSYQSAPIWKRMVVISAGVFLNVVAGALLFVVVFMAGLETQPPWVGTVEPDSPAERARPINGPALGVREPGLRPEDRIIEVDGKVPDSFDDVMMASMTAARGEAVHMRVVRDGVGQPLEFSIVPEWSPLSRYREIGVRPPPAPRIVELRTDEDRQLYREELRRLGWSDRLEPGMRLVRVGDRTDPATAASLPRALQKSEGRPVEAVFEGPSGTVAVTLEPSIEFQTDLVPTDDDEDEYLLLQHLLGLTPVMTVAQANERGTAQGLRDGDVFVRLGALDYPSVPAGIREIRAHTGRSLDLVIERRTGEGEPERIPLTAQVSDEGQIGFRPGSTADDSVVVALPPERVRGLYGEDSWRTPPARELVAVPGTRIEAAGGEAVSNLGQLREVLRAETRAAWEAGRSATVTMQLRVPGEESARELPWTLDAESLDRLHRLEWTGDAGLALFPLEQVTLRADDPVEAIGMGLAETKRMVVTTYITFARLFQGTVKIEHLKGPVGIAQLGSRVAERGFIWFLFFMGLISINLAVINFLPLPIVDGGHFVFLLYEQIRGRPVPAAIRNAVTLAGLVLIVLLFLLITYRDVMNLFSA